jgi:hypothetical protein
VPQCHTVVFGLDKSVSVLQLKNKNVSIKNTAVRTIVVQMTLAQLQFLSHVTVDTNILQMIIDIKVTVVRRNLFRTLNVTDNNTVSRNHHILQQSCN